MKIDISTLNMDVTPDHKEYVEEKILAAGKAAGNFDDESAQARVEIKKNGDRDYHEQVELHVQVSIPGTSAQATVLAGEVTEAADLAADKVRAQLRKYKDKQKDIDHADHFDELTEGAASVEAIDPDEAV